MTSSYRAGSEGYTLAELSVGLLVAVAVAEAFAVTFTASARWGEAWRDAVAAEAAAQVVVERIARDLHASERVEQPEPNAWWLLQDGPDTLRYRLAGAALTRDGVPVHSAGVAVDSLRLRASEPGELYASTEGGEPGLPVAVSVRLVVHVRSHVRVVETVVGLRHGRPWRELP